MKFAVIPAYEPGEGLTELASELKRRGFEAVVADDGSGEAYAGIFREASKSARVISCGVNRGKGRAMKEAFAWLRGRVGDGDAIVTLDCDGQHKVEDAEKLCEAARREPDALFLGSRRQSKASPLRSRVGNAFTRNAFRLSTGLRVYDTQTGLRAFSARLLPQALEIPGERYEYEMNALLYCARHGIPVREIPVETIYIDGNAGSHFRPLGDSWRVCQEIFKFSCSSLLGFATDYALYSLLVIAGVAPLSANIAARCVSALLNFVVNRRFVFRDSGPVAQSALRYAALALGILCCNSALLVLLTSGLGVHPLAAKPVTEVILFLFSYLAQRNFIFGEREAL